VWKRCLLSEPGEIDEINSLEGLWTRCGFISGIWSRVSAVRPLSRSRTGVEIAKGQVTDGSHRPMV